MHLNTSRWRVYLLWSSLVSVVFFTIYLSCNWISAQSDNVHHLYLRNELSVPFIPSFIIGYFSIYGLFFLPPFFLEEKRMSMLGKQLISATLIAAIVFLVYPTTLGFTRVVPEKFSYAVIFSYIFMIDKPYNMMPSLHVVYSSIIVFAILDVVRTRLMKSCYIIWLVLICFSTLFVHQHHIIDVITGLVLAYSIRFLHKFMMRV